MQDAVSLCFVPVGLGLVIIHYFGGSDGLPNAELAAVAFGAPYCVLGVLAFLGGRTGRPALTLFASTPLVLMSMISAVLLPLVLLAGFLVVRAVSGLVAGHQQHLSPSEMFLPFLVTAAPVLAFGYLLFHQDPASWQSDEHTFHSASDIVTVSESILSLGAVAFSAVITFFWIFRDPSADPGSITD
ncbi:MAG: hypothetical protein OXC00_07115 [Acidimicrobiaceae bacterium]|nr:hypothetical protein [Acidimicrobiaceae bacterium]